MQEASDGNLSTRKDSEGAKLAEKDDLCHMTPTEYLRAVGVAAGSGVTPVSVDRKLPLRLQAETTPAFCLFSIT